MYYSLVTGEDTRQADLYIFGDITSWEWLDSDVSSTKILNELADLDVDDITVHINSYGGEVAEGLAIYNTLKTHKANITTVCDGFACSIASVIFMAGDKRIMSNSSMLMIHNAWTYTQGNAEELRKTAEDLDKISSASINAYLEHINIEEAELKALLDEESWLTPTEALDMGFATEIRSEGNPNHANQSAKKLIMEKIKQANKSVEPIEPKEPIDEPIDEPEGDDFLEFFKL